MRIKQLFCKFGYHFSKAMADKYGLVECANNINPKEPLFMFGCYDFRHAHIAVNHVRFNRQLAVICWGGSDSSNLRRTVDAFNWFWPDLLRDSGVKHIAISHWIADDLDFLQLPYHRIPVTPHDFSNIKPCPVGDSVYMYNADSKFYGAEIYQEIRKRLPQYNYIEASFGSYERDELMDLYRKSFIGLRFTEHDGLSNTLCELGMMGRRVITNGDTPNCIFFDKDNIDAICQAINDEFSMTRDMDYTEPVSKAVADYLNIGDDFLNTEFYE